MQNIRWTRRNLLKTTGLAGLGWPLARAVEEPGSNRVRIDVRMLGARGDGATLETEVLQLALDRVAAMGGGVVEVPAGRYRTGSLVVHARTTLHLEAGATLAGSDALTDYPLTEVRWEGRWTRGRRSLLWAEDAEQIALTGSGKIEASAAIRGRVAQLDGTPVQRVASGDNVARMDVVRNPALLEFARCRGVLLEGVELLGNEMWAVHPVCCEDVVVRSVAVKGGADGIDVDSCRRVLIEDCSFDTGDDCISLKSGRGLEGWTLARPTEDVRIVGCSFRDARWAAIGIGSETSGGIRRVQIERCRTLGAKTYAIYIKSRPGRGASIEQIAVHDFTVEGAGMGFLRINLLTSGFEDPDPVPGLLGIPIARNFSFSQIKVRDVPVLVQADEIHPARPLEGLRLRDVSGNCGAGIRLAHMRGVELDAIAVQGYGGALLATRDVDGVGLSGAVELDERALPVPIAERLVPYQLR